MVRAWLAVPAACLVSAVAATASPNAATTRDCAPGEAYTTFDWFVQAFNAGDRTELDRVIAPPSSFQWFSVSGAGKRLGAAARDRATMSRYFAARHAQRDQFRQITWRGGGNANGYAHFQFSLTRMADDELPSRYDGKGAVICDGGPEVIAVWSMARTSTLPVIAPPARLSARGWRTGSARLSGAGCAGCVQTETWASTVPYRDAANQLPPHRTMAALSRDGVIVHVTRSWEPSPPAWVRRTRVLRITPGTVTASFEGNTTAGRVSRWVGSTWRSGSYVDVWVLFGRPTPAAAQIRRAQAELDRAVFAPWRIGSR